MNLSLATRCVATDDTHINPILWLDGVFMSSSSHAFWWKCWLGGWAGSSWCKWGTRERDYADWHQLNIWPKFLCQCWSIFPALFWCESHPESLASCVWFFFSFLSCTFANIKIEVKCIFPASSSLLLPPKEMKWIFCASYSISEERNLLSDNGYLKIWCFCLCRLEPRKKPGRTIIQPAHGDQGWAMHAVPDQ